MPLLSTAYIGLLILGAATPVFLFFDNLILAGAIQLYVSVAMLLVAIGMSLGEARHVFRLIRIPAALAAIPLLWMLIQLLPIAPGGLSRSVWESAGSALGTPNLLASITIDPGLTLIAVCYFATMVGIAFIASVISIDRQRAEKLLTLLACAAAAISLILLASRIGGFLSMNEPGTNSYATMTTAAILGVILFAAGIVMTIEKQERHGLRALSSKALLPIGLPAAGLVVCFFGLIAGDAGRGIFASACGLAAIAIIYIARRLGFGPRAGLAMSCVAIVAVTMVIWTKGDPAIGDFSLRYANAANSQAASLDKRMVDAVGFAGSGAGTFPAVSTIYGAQVPSDIRPATFAAKIAIEFGRPALWVFVVLACLQMVMLARGAFNRGRDCFYALAGAGVTVAMLLNSFVDASLSNFAISILTALTLGLGSGQSVGRSL